ncbi:multiprotein-bridging factor 1 family protein [Streptomyces sp. NPDC051569]|uniref:multiprotein-bridging factor 1 family protein n=1 Tax=Streptomyces sp. NPDC051569 TaxID=3365661 RepID=UPI0037916F6F
MTESPPDLTTGERIRYHRERRGMSRPVLAGLVGRSPDWLKKVERGDRPVRSLAMLSKLAQALRLDDLAKLTGADSTGPVTDVGKLSHPSVPAFRDAIHLGLFRRPQALPESVEVLSGRVRQAWDTWHSSAHQRTEVGAALPALLAAVHAATRRTEGPERRQMYAVMAEAYALAQQFAAHTTEPELYWIVVDRARMAAEESDDPVLLAFAAWVSANGLRAAGHTDEALGQVIDAAESLRPRLEHGSDSLRAIFGALCLHAGITYGQEGEDGNAWYWWGEADRTAGKLPVGYLDPWTAFSPGNVSVSGVTIGVDLRTPGAALQRAAETVPESVLSVERRSRLFIDTARSEFARKEYASALHWLGKGFDTSPEGVRYVPVGRRLAADLALQSPPSLRGDARNLAERVGVAA